MKGGRAMRHTYLCQCDECAAHKPPALCDDTLDLFTGESRKAGGDLPLFQRPATENDDGDDRETHGSEDDQS